MSLTFWIVVCASIGGILYGYDIGVFSGTIFFIQKNIGLSLEDIGVVGGAVFMGGLFGTMITGYLSDKFGRRAMIIMGSVLFILGVSLILITKTFYTLLEARIVLGIAAGVISVAVPSYLSEIAPTKIRGRSVTIFQLFLTAGILIAYIINTLLAPSGSWREMYALLIIPSTILFVAMFFLPESPRWLMSKSREAKALFILKKTRPEAEAITDLAGMKLAHENDQKSRWRDLFNRRIALPFTIVLLVAVLNQLTAMNAVLLYAPALFRDAGLHNAQTAIEASILIGLTNFIATIIGAILIDQVGRRFLLMFGTGGMTLAYLFLAIATDHSWPPLCSVMGILVFIFCFAVGPGFVVWLVLTELLPTGVRGKGLAVALFANSLTSWLVTTAFLEVKLSIGLGNTYIIFALCTLLYFLVAWKLLPETKQRSLEQIQEDFATHTPQKDKKGS